MIIFVCIMVYLIIGFCGWLLECRWTEETSVDGFDILLWMCLWPLVIIVCCVGFSILSIVPVLEWLLLKVQKKSKEDE